MEDVAAIIYDKIVAGAQKSASASRVVLTYCDVGAFESYTVTINKVSHGYYAFNHSCKRKVFMVTAKNVCTVIDMIVMRMREIMDCKYAFSRTVRVLHDLEEYENLPLWCALTHFHGNPHDESQFDKLRSELEEAARVAWNGVVNVHEVRKMDERDGLR